MNKPRLSTGQADRVPACQRRWWARMDLNHRPDAYKTSALTAELLARVDGGQVRRLLFRGVAAAGIATPVSAART